MSHYAKVFNGTVTNVIKASAEFIASYNDELPGEWIQTSYNTRGNVHYGPDGRPDGGVALRGNFGGIGSIYDAEKDAFYPPAPFPNWVLTENFVWRAPIPRPTDGKKYGWDPETSSWVLRNTINTSTTSTSTSTNVGG